MARLHVTGALLLLFLAVDIHAGTLAVIVNPTSGVTHLDQNELLDIFMGRYRVLRPGLVALPVDLPPGSVERQQFYMWLAHRTPAEMSSYWVRLVFSGQASPPFRVADSRAALAFVASNPSAIAYVDRAAVNDSVRMVLELAP